MRTTCGLTVAAVLTCSTFASAQTTVTWTQLSLDTCKVNDFLRDRPASNGAGVVIAVLDTGVDPALPGLDRTPDGAVKVIDVQDFSGEGDTELHRVRTNDAGNKLVEYDADGNPLEYTLPDLPAGDAERRFWFGWLEEKKFVNSDVSDLNDNSATDDRFAICVTALAGDGDDQAVAFVDTDLDRDFSDEKPLRNYRLNFDTFMLARPMPEKQIDPLTFAVNIFLRESKIVFHFDDGAHGTHVAGIAAGHRINGQEGLNGVAPGAKVISLKIGQNAIGGISTTEAKKKAMEYAGRFAREHGVPVVCNLSYGVESTIEGHSDIDAFFDTFLRENPYVVFCTSAGNEGPGLSSVGTPAAATEAITVAALMAADTGRDVRGYQMDGPVVTVFSSRGGELAKPDIATPGWSTSTVPRYVRTADFWSGTSMASPYAAGLCALLLSDALARDPNARVRAADVKYALQRSAQPLPDATSLDFGWGVPDAVKAAAILHKRVEKSHADPVLGYSITTRSPHGFEGASEAAYWRSTWFPADEAQVFTIAPVFAPGTDENTRIGFTRKFTLRARTPWCRVAQESIYLRSAQTAQVEVTYDAGKLREPGLYVGIVEALDGEDVALRMLSTVVVPHRAGPAENHTLLFRNQTVKGWLPQRWFVAVPPGASGMHVALFAPASAKSKASIERIFDSRGFQHRNRANLLDTDSGKREVTWSITDELVPGVWELDVVADRPDRTWPYDLRVRFFGLHADPRSVTECASPDTKPSGELTVTNLFDTPLHAAADGRIEGFRMRKEDEFKGLKDELSYKVRLGPEHQALRIDLEMTLAAWAEATDIAVAVLDNDGQAVLQSAFDNNTFTATARHPAPGSEAELTVRITAGFAVADDQRKTPITVQLDHLLADAVPLAVTRGDSSSIDFAPGVPLEIAFEAESALPKAPEKTRPVGYLRFVERGSDEVALRVPIELE